MVRTLVSSGWRTNSFDGHFQRENAGCAKGMGFPFAECALASVGDPAKRDEALGDEWTVLEGCCENAVLMGEDNGGGKVGRFLGGVFTDDAAKSSVICIGDAWKGR